MTKSLTFRNGVGHSKDGGIPRLAETMQLQALYGYVTSDDTEGAEPPATFDCVSFHDRVNSGSGVGGDHDGRNGSVAIDTEMAVAKPLLTQRLNMDELFISMDR